MFASTCGKNPRIQRIITARQDVAGTKSLWRGVTGASSLNWLWRRRRLSWTLSFRDRVLVRYKESSRWVQQKYRSPNHGGALKASCSAQPRIIAMCCCRSWPKFLQLFIVWYTSRRMGRTDVATIRPLGCCRTKYPNARHKMPTYYLISALSILNSFVHAHAGTYSIIAWLHFYGHSNDNEPASQTLQSSQSSQALYSTSSNFWSR